MIEWLNWVSKSDRESVTEWVSKWMREWDWQNKEEKRESVRVGD